MCRRLSVRGSSVRSRVFSMGKPRDRLNSPQSKSRSLETKPRVTRVRDETYMPVTLGAGRVLLRARAHARRRQRAPRKRTQFTQSRASFLKSLSESLEAREEETCAKSPPSQRLSPRRTRRRSVSTPGDAPLNASLVGRCARTALRTEPEQGTVRGATKSRRRAAKAASRAETSRETSRRDDTSAVHVAKETSLRPRRALWPRPSANAASWASARASTASQRG